MDSPKILLCSESPRRHEILKAAGIPHEVYITGADEKPGGVCPPFTPFAVWYAAEAAELKIRAAKKLLFPDNMSPEKSENPETSDGKASDGTEHVRLDAANTEDFPSGRIIAICADTIVSPEGSTIFGKPENEDAAERMLKRLSGEEHIVAGAIRMSDGYTDSKRTCITKVKMKKLSDRTIKEYIETGEPFGKAGAYAIQGRGALLIESISGDYLNIVGLSLYQVSSMLECDFNYNLI